MRLKKADGTIQEFKLDLRRVVPVLEIEPPDDLALDLPYAVGTTLGVEEPVWRTFGLSASRSVPMDILHGIYDGALFYGAMRVGLLNSWSSPLTAERILLHLLSTVPEVLVKHRFYLGFARPDGEIELVDGAGREIRPTIENPYRRLFSLQDPKVFRQVKDRFAPRVLLRRSGEEYIVADGKGNHPSRTLGFQRCLGRLIPDDGSPVRLFLSKVYRDVRLGEAHTGRIGDNAVFEVDDLVSGLFKAMNHLFTQELGLPHHRQLRGPFTIPLLRVAGTKPLTAGQALTSTHWVHLEVRGAEPWYRRSP